MDKPPRIEPKLKSAPQIRGIYWCDFWEDVMLPEMWKKRPVLVVSYKNTLSGPCTVLAISTDSQEELSGEWGYKLPIQVQRGRESWVVCNHIYTVSPSRLEQVRGGVLRIAETSFNEVLERLYRWLPRIPDPVLPFP
ncbi:MAG: type II toxin-antitoxin system PemK/MazF family toxin [Alphaproteobacteria bacterium]|nr:type II toxin-antitoxin system PemK/MazF family toxin [Alphaproteobacteria bacterium]